MLRVVADTNQFVSGLINDHGPSASLLRAWRQHKFVLIISDDIIEEVRRVLNYPRIARKYKLEDAHIDSFLSLLEHEAVILRHLPKLKVIKEDPDDDKFLSCAVQGKADYIISGDSHLLELKSYQKIPIITVSNFMQLLHKL